MYDFKILLLKNTGICHEFYCFAWTHTKNQCHFVLTIFVKFNIFWIFCSLFLAQIFRTVADYTVSVEVYIIYVLSVILIYMLNEIIVIPPSPSQNRCGRDYTEIALFLFVSRSVHFHKSYTNDFLQTLLKCSPQQGNVHSSKCPCARLRSRSYWKVKDICGGMTRIQLSV